MKSYILDDRLALNLEIWNYQKIKSGAYIVLNIMVEGGGVATGGKLKMKEQEKNMKKGKVKDRILHIFKFFPPSASI